MKKLLIILLVLVSGLCVAQSSHYKMNATSLSISMLEQDSTWSEWTEWREVDNVLISVSMLNEHRGTVKVYLEEYKQMELIAISEQDEDKTKDVSWIAYKAEDNEGKNLLVVFITKEDTQLLYFIYFHIQVAYVVEPILQQG